LLLDTELVKNDDGSTLTEWRKMSTESIEEISKRIDSSWLQLLMAPPIKDLVNNPIEFAQKHNELLQSKA
jgi:hypothetical protein